MREFLFSKFPHLFYLIGQALTNLISNAIKYSPQADKIIITSSTDGKNITVCVQDFGIGISTDMQEQVFDRFFRVKNESLKIQQGLGLGLYITAEIIKNHRGTINVTSKKDKGSIFCFTLPVEFSPPHGDKLKYSLMAYDLIK